MGVLTAFQVQAGHCSATAKGALSLFVQSSSGRFLFGRVRLFVPTCSGLDILGGAAELDGAHAGSEVERTESLLRVEHHLRSFVRRGGGGWSFVAGGGKRVGEKEHQPEPKKNLPQPNPKSVKFSKFEQKLTTRAKKGVGTARKEQSRWGTVVPVRYRRTSGSSRRRSRSPVNTKKGDKRNPTSEKCEFLRQGAPRFLTQESRDRGGARPWTETIGSGERESGRKKKTHEERLRL